MYANYSQFIPKQSSCYQVLACSIENTVMPAYDLVLKAIVIEFKFWLMTSWFLGQLATKKQIWIDPKKKKGTESFL